MVSVFIWMPLYEWCYAEFKYLLTMEQHALKNVNNCLNTNIYSYLETSDGQSSNIYLNGFHFFNTRGVYCKNFYGRNLIYFNVCK